jgi:alpha-L-rhamnosidase
LRISTGFVGTPLVCDALTDTGHADVAYRLLLQTQCPSWLYPVTMGATTIWERWDSMLPDGSINPGGMTSFNHYALGAVADWLHRRVAGLAPAEPGYRRLRVQPVPTAALTHASAEHSTPYGLASVAWRRADGEFQLEVHVPVGASAEVFLPGEASPREVGHGDHRWQVPDPVASAGFDWHSASVRDLMDEASLWEQVAKVAASTGIAQEGDNQAAGMLASYLDQPAARVAQALAPDERFSGAMGRLQ